MHTIQWLWNAYWDRPDVIAKSEQQRKNRMSEVAGPGTGASRHTGGSRSTTSHHHKLRTELQKEPDAFETFKRTHQRKNGQYIDERSKRIVEEMEARINAATQEVGGSSEPPTINMSQLLVDVAGGVKKQRIYGLGSKAVSFVKSNASCNSSATSQFSQNAMEEMKEAVEKQVTEQMETMFEARMQAERAAMQA